MVGDVRGAAGMAVVGQELTDEPFPFASYVAIASARDHLGPVQVHARYLPYGVWWDRLRPTVALVRDGEPPDERLPIEGVWVGPGRFVTRKDPCYAEVAAAYFVGDGLF